jgi:hypothetical protein
VIQERKNATTMEKEMVEIVAGDDAFVEAGRLKEVGIANMQGTTRTIARAPQGLWGY